MYHMERRKKVHSRDIVKKGRVGSMRLTHGDHGYLRMVEIQAFTCHEYGSLEKAAQCSTNDSSLIPIPEPENTSLSCCGFTIKTIKLPWKKELFLPERKECFHLWYTFVSIVANDGHSW